MNQIATVETTGALSVGGAASIGTLMMNPAVMAQLDAMATRMASGKCTVPDHLRGSVGDCYAIVMQAVQWGMNPYAVAQKTHLVSGKLGYEAQLVNAVITSLAPTKDRLHYEWFGAWEKILGKVKSRTITKQGRDPFEIRVPDWKVEDEHGLGVRVWATLKGEDAPRELELLLTQALTRNSTLWADDPRQQLAYLATKRWSRLYCPDVILGVYTPDEFEPAPMRDITPPPDEKPAATRTAGVKDKLRGKREPVASPVVPAEAVQDAELVDAELDKSDQGQVDDLVARVKGAQTVAEVKALWPAIGAFLGASGRQQARQEFRPELMAAYTQRGRELDAIEKAAAAESQQEGSEGAGDGDE